jgi:hypothetical protein
LLESFGKESRAKPGLRQFAAAGWRLRTLTQKVGSPILAAMVWLRVYQVIGDGGRDGWKDRKSALVAHL